jgi:hypothetical protein
MIYYLGFPFIFICGFINYLQRDREWCKSQNIGLKRILKNEFSLWRYCNNKEKRE